MFYNKLDQLPRKVQLAISAFLILTMYPAYQQAAKLGYCPLTRYSQKVCEYSYLSVGQAYFIYAVFALLLGLYLLLPKTQQKTSTE